MNSIADCVRRWRFPQNYFEGQAWFRTAAAQAGADLTAAANPHAKGPGGELLATDVAWFGPRDAKRVFLSISGTHGQEYAAGAALQLQWIVERGPASLPSGVALCMIHAHNPYGAAYGSRGNENFVDLNRNYLDADTAAGGRQNPLYPELFDLLFTTEMDEHVLDDAMDAFYAFVARHGAPAAINAMGSGQATHPSGNLFCGTRPEWSTEHLRSVVRERLGHAEHVAVIDWHTGLGAFGEVSFHVEPSNDPGVERVVAEWWLGSDTGAVEQEDGGHHFPGQVGPGVARELRARGAAVACAVVELGTFGNRGVLAALLIDRWLRMVCADRSAPKAVRLHTMMMERLNPSLPEWRAAVLGAGSGVYERTLAGLSRWS